MNCLRIALYLSLVSCLTGCDLVPQPPNEGDSLDTTLRALLAANQVTPLVKPDVDAAKVRLGQALFFDKIVSGNRDISCGTCHAPAASTSDGLPLSKGVGGSGLGPARAAPLDSQGNPIFIPRHSPDVFNRADFTTLFWDGRVHRDANGDFSTPAHENLLPGLDSALAAQAMFPVTSRAEMRGSAGTNELADLADDDLPGIWSGIMDRLQAIPEYSDLFEAAYPGTPQIERTFAHAANAMAAFEIDHWTLIDSPFDEYLLGDDSTLSDSQKRGAILFFDKADCGTCHTGPLLTDELFHNRVIPQLGPGKGHGADGLHDFGREGVTEDIADRFKFRTPPLRNVTATAPYMHDGAYVALEDAVRHMLDPRGAAQQYAAAYLAKLPEELQSLYRAEQLSEIIAVSDPAETKAVALSDAEFSDLVAFLESLTSPRLGELFVKDIPESVPSGLSLAD